MWRKVKKEWKSFVSLSLIKFFNHQIFLKKCQVSLIILATY